MQSNTLVKVVIVAVVALVIWKKGIPWWNERHGASSSSSSAPAPAASSADDSCVSAAESAGESWGSGIGKFANPPYDLSAWDDFRSRVEQRIGSAEQKCNCPADSCTTARAAMNDLRSLVRDLDSSIRSGSPPPSDIVQRQESIDNAITSAREHARQGK